MTKCPVCGMNIDEQSAKKVVYQGRPYLVATENCRLRFDANPEKYAALAEHSEQHHQKRGCC